MRRLTELSCDECLDLAAAVTLDATDSDEDVRRVERHLADCPECQRELVRFREVTAALASAVPQVEPPDALRRRMLAAARTTPQAGRFWPRPLLRLRVAPAWVAAAASLVISLAAIVRVAMLQSEIAMIQQEAAVARDRAGHYQLVVSVLASDKLAIRPLRPVAQDVSSRGMVYMDPLSGNGMVMCRNLPAVAQGRAYQVWFVRGTERVSGGLLWPDGNGNGYAVIRVPTDVMTFDSVGLTDEPGSGSTWPTTARVMGTEIRNQ